MSPRPFRNLLCGSQETHLAATWKASKTRYDGPAASPVLYKDKLFIVDDNEEQSTLLALDKATGKELWRAKRPEGSNWATPFVWENSQRTELVTPGTGMNRVYSLEGELLYEFGGNSSITIATPYAKDDLLYVSSGYVLDPKKPLFAIKPGASGDITLGDQETSNDFIQWCQKEAAPYNPSTLLYEGRIYVLYDRGFFACFDARPVGKYTANSVSMVAEPSPVRLGPIAGIFFA